MGRIQAEYRDKGVQVVAVNIDPSTPLSQWEDYWRKLGGGDVVWAQDAEFRASGALNVQFAGTKVVIDRQGRIVRKAAGVAGYENLRQWVDEALAVE